ncbi:MAG: hypothetical protein Tsb009_13740 [Planctomycetaceae bacterium]
MMNFLSSVHNFAGRRRKSAATIFTLGLIGISIGCLKQMLFWGYLIGGPPSIEPDFEKMTKESLTDPDVTVAVVCYAPPELKLDNSDIDEDIAKYVSHRLAKKKVKVITPGRVQEWLDKNPEWDKPEEVGEFFKTTYVIFIEMEDYNLYEKGNQDLYRGRAEVSVSVWKMDDDGTAEAIYRKQLTSQFPLVVGTPTTEITYSRFKRRYLSRLSEEIGRLFYEHFNGDDIPDAT